MHIAIHGAVMTAQQQLAASSTAEEPGSLTSAWVPPSMTPRPDSIAACPVAGALSTLLHRHTVNAMHPPNG